MKAINFKQFATFGFAAMLLASCSDSMDNNSGSGDVTKSAVGKEVTSITDAQELAARVFNFNTAQSSTTNARTRASVDNTPNLTMPNTPTPTGTEVTQITQNTTNGNYIVKSKIDEGVLNSLNNTNIYIENGGELTITNHWGCSGNVNIYVLNGGKLHYNHSNNVQFNIFAYKGSTFDSNNKLYIENGKGIYVEGDWETSAEITNAGNLYVGGNLKAEKINFFNQAYIKGDLDLGDNKYHTDTQNANVYIGGNLKCGDFWNNQGSTTNVQGEDGLDLSKKDITINGTVNFAGTFKANTIKVQGTSDFYACGIVTKGLFQIDSNSAQINTGYLKAASINQMAGSKINLNPNGYIDCEGTYENTNNGVGYVNLTGSGSVALFKAKRVKYNGNNDYNLGDYKYFTTCYIFNAESEGSKLYLDVEEFENNNIVLTDLNQVPKGGRNAYWSEVSSDYIITDTKCGKTIKPNSDPTPGPDPDDNTDSKKDLDNITDIQYDHTHNISATCIQPYNGKMYMSYHTRGTGHGACIEVFETKNKKTTLLQYLQDKEQALDFNHLMIDDKASTPQLYVVGNSFKSGGMLARIDINSAGLMNTDVKEIDEKTTINPLTVVPLVKNVQKGSAEAKYDENCIVRDGDKLLVMSTRGYEVYNPETLESLGSKATAGKSKHIAISGNDMATLHYANAVQDSLEQVDGIIETFTTGQDILTATPSKTFNVGGIAPNHGKNTIAIDGNYIYVCRSEKGLSCFDRTTGTEVWNWTAPLTKTTQVPQGYANGVTYDSQYIYLACGGYGLVVLDKNDKTAEGKPVVVAKKRATAGNSANYVTLDGGYIYVAYGKSRIQVFQLVDKKVSSGDTKY